MFKIIPTSQGVPCQSETPTRSAPIGPSRGGRDFALDEARGRKRAELAAIRAALPLPPYTFGCRTQPTNWSEGAPDLSRCDRGLMLRLYDAKKHPERHTKDPIVAAQNDTAEKLQRALDEAWIRRYCAIPGFSSYASEARKELNRMDNERRHEKDAPPPFDDGPKHIYLEKIRKRSEAVEQRLRMRAYFDAINSEG